MANPYEMDFNPNLVLDIIDELRFYGQRQFIQKGRTAQNSRQLAEGVATIGKRNPRDGLRDVQISERKTKTVDIGIGSKPHGSSLPAFTPAIRGRSFIDYRG